VRQGVTKAKEGSSGRPNAMVINTGEDERAHRICQ
jgi:hypothetical protein